MIRLRKLISHCYKRIATGGRCPMLTRIARDYKKEYGIVPHRHRHPDKMQESFGKKIADIYEKMRHLPENKMVQAAYAQLAEEVVNQFQFLNAREPIVYEPFEGAGEPYKDSADMLKDFHNYHLYFFKTSCGFGESVRHLNNKMLEKTGIMVGNYELLINDIFRIVHDIFGHAMFGYGFGPVGEDRAWFAHLQMFTPLAAAALTTETRGQNCWVNFGPHLRDSEGNVYKENHVNFVPPQNRPFAEQKMNILPAEFSNIDVWEDVNGVKAAFRKY